LPSIVAAAVEAVQSVRTPKDIRMGRHVDAKPRLTVVGSAMSLALGASLLLGGVAQAAATVQSFGGPPVPFSGTLPVDGSCGGGTGTVLLTGTEQVIGQFTLTANGIEVHGTDTTIARVDLPADSAYGPGAYILSSTVGHFSFIQHGPVTTFILAGSDTPEPIYTASGTKIGVATFHGEEHMTSLDLGAPGPSPEDKVVVDFQRFSGSCPK
jgi:hypothetical protein